MRLSIVLLFFFYCLNSTAQKLVQVTDEVLTVNSVSALNGITRNTTEVTLPEKTKSYIYRISVSAKGKNAVNNSLLDLLKTLGGEISLASSLAQLAVKNNDNLSIDAFIFNNTYDVDNFVSKNDENWNACKSLLGRVSCCFATTDCIGRKIFFGFRNKNISQGVDVKLEIVAIVDSSMTSDYKYSYTIENSLDKELQYQISMDGVKWQSTSQARHNQQIFTFDQKEIYFKIYTERFKFVSYKLNPAERYRIIWNSQTGKLDIIKY